MSKSTLKGFSLLDYRFPNDICAFISRTTCYLLIDHKLNFHNAERFCKSEFGGHLASITNISEFHFIERMLDSYNPEDQAVFIDGNRSWNSGNKCQIITFSLRNTNFLQEKNCIGLHMDQMIHTVLF